MTQKELLYYEDAIGHEGNVISILKGNMESLEDEDLRKFFESEIEIHQNIKEKLMDLLKEKVNE